MTVCWPAMFVLLALCAMLPLHGQTTYEINSDDSKVWVDGTSTLKKWTATVQTMSGSIHVDSTGQVSTVRLSFDATTMDGGRGADMNKKIYKALKADQYPQITFEGTGAASNGHDLAATGTIHIGGEKMETSIQGDGALTARLTGSKALKLSEFSIEPPTAMFGQIVTHDDITIHFDLSFNPINQ